MYRGRSKFLPIALLAIVAIIAIVAMVSLGKALLSGGGQSEVTRSNPASRALLNAEADRSVSMTVRGQIVASEDFRSYVVEISPISRKMTIYKGYKNKVLKSVRLPNSTKAYSEFVSALNRSDFAKEAELSPKMNDTDGICATGRLYTFEMLQAQSVTHDSWTTSCRNASGSFKGDAVFAKNLFLKQIPNSSDLLKGINL